MSLPPIDALTVAAVLIGAYLVGLLFMLAVSFPFWASAPYEPKLIQEILVEPNLAHWSCSASERQRFLQHERRRLAGMLLRRLLLSAAIAAGVLLFLFLVESLRGSVIDTTSALSAIGVGAVVAGTFAGVAPQTNSYLNLRRLRLRYGAGSDQGDGNVIISRKGAYMFGEYFTLNGALVSLHGVALEAGDPPALVFETHTRRSRNSVTKEQIFVPVAGGAQAQAEALAKKFPGVG